MNRLCRHFQFIDNNSSLVPFRFTVFCPQLFISMQQVPLQMFLDLRLQLRDGQRSLTIDPA